MRSYSHGQRPEIQSLLQSIGIPCHYVSQNFIKPQGILCDSNVLYTLAVAKEWKVAIMSAFERAEEIGRLNKNVVFFTEHTQGRFIDKSYRDLIEVAAKRLGVSTHWMT